MCRDVYHCTPSQLKQEDYRVVALHMAFIEAEQEVRQQEEANKSKGKKRRS